MKKIMFTDVTIRSCEASGNLISFKEKVEAARNLEKLNISVIELPSVIGSKENEMLISTVSAFVKNAVISVPVGFDEKSVEVTAKALASVKKPRICVAVPVSAVQMEYVCHKKPKAVLELIPALIKKAKEFKVEVEFAALDATRCEAEFLKTAILSAVTAGADFISVCDDAGTMLPNEFADFIKDVAEYCTAPLCVACSNELNLASACSVAAINAGAVAVKTSLGTNSAANLEILAKILRMKGDSIGIETDIKFTELNRCVDVIKRIFSKQEGKHIVIEQDTAEFDEVLKCGDDEKRVAEIVKKCGYDLSDEDMIKVYEAVFAVAKKKIVTVKELDAIVAVNAVQVPAAYKLKSFVINSGNIINATANIELEKDGNIIRGFCAGDGPIDAAFLAIEQIIGHRYELDDFQIQSITEGRQAMGSAVIRLRANGVVYSGKGVSTDIIEASIMAYLNAVNKIVYEENN